MLSDVIDTTVALPDPSHEKPKRSIGYDCLEDVKRQRIGCSMTTEAPPPEEEVCARERLKKHRSEMAGRVWIPEIWGQEGMLKDWIDCSALDTSLMPNGLVSAREALVVECRQANTSGLRIENRCS